MINTEYKKNNKKNIYLFVSICIAILLILPKDVLWAKDRHNYLDYAMQSNILFNRYMSRGILDFISNEPLFLVINIILNTILSPENVIKSIIFISTIIVLYSCGKLTNYNIFTIIIFLIVPQILKNHVIHLRQGLALSIYLLGVSSTNKLKYIRYLSPLIHTSFFFVIAFEMIDCFLKAAKLKYDSRLLIAFGILVIIPLLIPTIAKVFGDRRYSQYAFGLVRQDIGLGFLIWIIFSIVYIFVINKNNKINIICCYGIIFYITSYFTLDFTARIFENIIPIILISSINYRQKSIRYLFILFFIVFGITQYIVGGGNWSI